MLAKEARYHLGPFWDNSRYHSAYTVPPGAPRCGRLWLDLEKIMGSATVDPWFSLSVLNRDRPGILDLAKLFSGADPDPIRVRRWSGRRPPWDGWDGWVLVTADVWPVASPRGGGKRGSLPPPTSDQTPREIDADPRRFSCRKNGGMFTGFAPTFYMHRRYCGRSLVLRFRKKKEL